jgi:hypothetical protein
MTFTFIDTTNGYAIQAETAEDFEQTLEIYRRLFCTNYESAIDYSQGPVGIPGQYGPPVFDDLTTGSTTLCDDPPTQPCGLPLPMLPPLPLPAEADYEPIFTAKHMRDYALAYAKSIKDPVVNGTADLMRQLQYKDTEIKELRSVLESKEKKRLKIQQCLSEASMALGNEAVYINPINPFGPQKPNFI